MCVLGMGELKMETRYEEIGDNGVILTIPVFKA